MKFRAGSYLYRGEVNYCIEYNETDKDYSEDWFELEDLTKEMVEDIVKLLNKKYSKKPYYKYKKS
jgi:hypothetical protein